jgi:hypothetical protein
MNSLTRRSLSGLCMGMLAVLSGCGSVVDVEIQGKADIIDPEGEVITTQTFETEPYLGTCAGEGVHLCMGARESDTGERWRFYGPIEGFEFQWGYQAKLVVQSVPIPDPPADGNHVHYKMVEMKSQSRAASGTTFFFMISHLITSAEDFSHFLPGSCAEGYSIFGGWNMRWPSKQLAFDKGVTCQAFESALSNGMEAIQLALSEPDAPLSVNEIWTP